MWSNIEKAAQIAVGDSKATAQKYVTETESFQTVVTEKVKERTKCIAENDRVNTVKTTIFDRVSHSLSPVKKATTRLVRQSPLAQKAVKTCTNNTVFVRGRGNVVASNSNVMNHSNNNCDGNGNDINNTHHPNHNIYSNEGSIEIEIEREIDNGIKPRRGDGDLSDIAWTDGSARSLPGLRVFGKQGLQTIVSSSSSRRVRDCDCDSETMSTRGITASITTTTTTTTTINNNNNNNNNNNPKQQKRVQLPILMFPGIASSGLYVENSGLDNKKFKGRRVWLNAAFLAASKLDANLCHPNEDDNNPLYQKQQKSEPYIRCDDVNVNGNVKVTADSESKRESEREREAASTRTSIQRSGIYQHKSEPYIPYTTSISEDRELELERESKSKSKNKRESANIRAPSYGSNSSILSGIQSSIQSTITNSSRSSKREFAESEEAHEIRSAWLYHIALDKNMVDERPGNRVRTYDGIKAVEWLVDDAIGKTQTGVWVDTINFLEKNLGYVRGKSMDAVPYDWRLPPMHTEVRDGYLTKTMARVERMYEENDKLPVIMACHSMGCKMGHYFLNFCLREKGREWIDRHIHTYMPIGAPHGGGHLTLKLAATGAGLMGMVDDHLLSLDEGLIMYRSWGSGPWLMPREMPKGSFPPCIVRREGELGIKVVSEIDVCPLFADRDKPPLELRLTIVFREMIIASTDFVPLQMVWMVSGPNDPMGDTKQKTPISMVLSFDETFYLAVPYLKDEDVLGSLVFYLEEPSGGLYKNHQSKLRRQFQHHTKWARTLKKEFTKACRGVAKTFGHALRVAVCERPLHLKASAFEASSNYTIDGSAVVESIVPFCKCQQTTYSPNDQDNDQRSDDGDGDGDDNGDENEINFNSENPRGKEDEELGYHHAFLSSASGVDSEGNQAIGSLSIHLSYSPPPDFTTPSEPTKTSTTCTTNFSVTCNETLSLPPPVVSRRRKYNTIHHDKIVYDAWNGRDLLYQDGFCSSIFDVNEDYYEQDPLGPVTKSALEAPPVNCVRSIYGIDVPTEVSAVYRKEPVVIIGDSKADCRYRIDRSAAFPNIDVKIDIDGDGTKYNHKNIDSAARAMMEGYQMKDGIVTETHETLQNVPGSTERRRCCGDGTVPYWSLVHCLTWKDSVPELTADELEGAVHRTILSDKRFHALLQQYCTVDDPRPPVQASTTMTTSALPTTITRGSRQLTERNVSRVVASPAVDATNLTPYV